MLTLLIDWVIELVSDRVTSPDISDEQRAYGAYKDAWTLRDAEPGDEILRHQFALWFSSGVTIDLSDPWFRAWFDAWDKGLRPRRARRKVRRG